MTDITALRDFALDHPDKLYLREAADEIERLRAKLADIANSIERDWQDPTEHANWCIEHAKT